MEWKGLKIVEVEDFGFLCSLYAASPSGYFGLKDWLVWLAQVDS